MTAHNFVWYDLMTPGLKAAESFYTAVAGWTAMDSGLTDRAYTLLMRGDAMVAGLMQTPPDLLAMGVKPAWNGHIGVDDVDAFVARVTAAGGHLHRPPEDIPNGIGRFAVVSDPGGASFLLFRGQGEPQSQPPPGTAGFIGWHELHAADGAAAWEFYSALFGWTKAEAVDMGPLGVYQTFSAGSYPIGGIMTRMPDSPAPFWLFYISVEAIDAAVERIVQAGGTVMMGPHQVPGGSWIVQAFDPQGGVFAVTSGQR